MSQFSFLASEFPDEYSMAEWAERHALSDPGPAVIYARKALTLSSFFFLLVFSPCFGLLCLAPSCLALPDQRRRHGGEVAHARGVDAFEPRGQLRHRNAA